MKNNKTTWKAWLIKKLLTNESTKEDILKILSENNLEDNENVIDNYDEINEKNLITNILALGKKSVEDIMVPRGEIIAIEENLNIENILSLVEIEAHSRMPVYRKNLDNILGFIHIKDIIKTTKNKNFKINSMLREILYVAPKSPILELLKRMRSSRIHMSLVVDEFGGVDGLVTIEDLVEEIVGEIEDEHDAEDNENKIEKLSSTKIIVDSSYKIIELEKYFDLKILEAKEIDTVGGFVFFLANKIPKKNESFKYKNKLNFKVLKASDRRIETLEIDKL
tara:strand:+ start:212 stop:1051 length:840 start_codon:yes stop_codon:yes gene_type:complete